MKKLFLFLTAALFSIGTWAATYSPLDNPATKTYGAITFLDVANTKANGKITKSGATFEGDSTVSYGALYVGKQLGVTTWYNCSDGSPESNWDQSAYTYANAVTNGFIDPSTATSNAINGYGDAKVTSGRVRFYYATGITSVAIMSADNSSSKYITLTIEEVAGNGDLSTVASNLSASSKGSSISLIEYTTGLSETKYYKISVGSNNTSNCKLYQIRFGKYIAPPCDATIPGNISKGELNAGVLTLNAAGSPESGDTWYWQATEDGTAKTNSGTSFNVNAAGTYYIRSYNTAADCWSDAKSITVAAVDLVTNYTVTYKDGATTLGTEQVAENGNPASYATYQTKAFASFVNWYSDSELSNAVTIASATITKDTTFYGKWNKNYAESVDFTTDTYVKAEKVTKSLATMISENNLNYACGGTFSGSEWGTTGEDAQYQGFKFKDKSVYIEFLVAANKRVTLLFGAYNATGTIKIGSAAAVACELTDSKYVINTESECIIRFTTSSSSSSTVTLKTITIADKPAQSDDATLGTLTYQLGEADPVNIPIVTGRTTYNVVLPYKTAIIPVVAATANDANANVGSITQAASTSGTATFTITAEDGTTTRDYTINFSVAPKDGLCLVWVNVTGQNASSVDNTKSYYLATTEASGIKNSSSFEGKTGYKFNSNGAYLGVTLSGDNKFQENDFVEVYVTTVTADKVRIFTDKTTADLTSVQLAYSDANMVQGTNRVSLPSTETNKLYLCRGDDKTDFSGHNPYVAYMAVYRPYPAPILDSISFNSTMAIVSSTSFTVVLPNNIKLGEMVVTPYIISNNPALTNGVVTTNAGAWVEGANTYRVTDKDGDYTDYTITLSLTGPATALDNTADEAKAVKFIENGQVVIFKDGKYFNVLGIQIR